MSIHATSTESYTGKNLLGLVGRSQGGLTGTVNSDGSISITGTAASSTGYSLFSPMPIQAGTYTMTISKVLSGDIVWSLASGVEFRITAGNTSVTRTLNSSYNGGGLYFRVTGGTAYNETLNIQLVSGSTPDYNFEPYVGGVPSPLINDVAHVSTSKNLLNMQSDSNGEYFGTTSQQTYSGKNLFNSYVAPNYTLSDGTITVDSDGIISMSGNTRNNGYCRVYTSFRDFAPSLVAGQTYYIYVNNEFDSGNRNYIYLYGSSFFWNSGQPHTITQAELDANIVLYGGYQATTKITIMITAASDTSYEPYVGGVPSPNPDYPQEVVTGKLASKNLYALRKTNKTTADVLYTYNSDGTFSLSGTASAGTDAKSDPIPISESGLTPGEKYSFWCDHNVGWGSNSCVYYVQSCDSGGNWIGNLMTFSHNGDTATMPSTTAQYVLFVAAISNGSSYSSYNNVKAQLVAEEQADNVFEPYFTPIEITQIGSYQDKVYKSGDSWYIYKEIAKVVLDGTGDYWTLGNGSGGEKRFRLIDSAVGNIPTNVRGTYCDKYKGVSQVSSVPTPNSIAQWSQQNMLLVTTNKTTYSLDDFKADLANSPVTAYCVGATPTDTVITDSATIAWLNKYDTDALPHHKYVNTRRTTYVGASGLSSAIDLYDGSYASALPTYSTANDHHLTTANGGTYTVSLQNISASIVSGTVTFSVFTNQRKIDFSWNGSATSTNVSVSLQADEYIKSIYAYIPQDADAGITLSQQLESGSLTDFEPYYNIVKIYAGDDLVFEDTSLTD